MTSSVQLLLAVLVLLVPGCGLLLALGVRDRKTLVGASAPCTVGMALLATMLLAVVGIGFSAMSLAVLTVLVIVGVVALQYLRSVRAVRNAVESPLPPVSGSAALTDRGLLTARLLGLLAGLAAIGLGVWTWHKGMGTWATPDQEHDPIVHSVATAFIHFTGRAAPWQILPADLLTGTPVAYYPSGFPAMSALVADFVDSPMTGMNLMTVAVLAVA